MFALFTGLVGGILHVISGPDHLAAIAPLSAETKKSSWNIGFKWGIGHTDGVFFIGILFILFRNIIPFNAISLYSERFVGIILIAIGIWGLQKIFRQKIQVFEHSHNNITHVHFYKERHTHSHTAFFIGIIHGLAGSSHFLGVLPALAMPTQTESILYIFAFGTGTISSMTVFSSLVGMLSERFSFNIRFYHTILAGFSLSAVTIGVIWLII